MLRLGQLLQRLALAAHAVVAQVFRDVEAALAEVKVQRGFVPVQDREVELVAAGSQAKLLGQQKGNRQNSIKMSQSERMSACESVKTEF